LVLAISAAAGVYETTALGEIDTCVKLLT
jgi:hypothetical protein